MAAEEVQGIVIKKSDYDDYDEIITLITATERISFIALGVRKITSKNRVALQEGNIINASIFRARLKGRLSKLKRATIVKQPPLLSNDTALVVKDILVNLQKIEEVASNLFPAIIEAFNYFGEDYNHHIKTYILFNQLSSFGVRPIMDKCCECGKKINIVGVDFAKGGFTCKEHTYRPLELPILIGFRLLSESFEKYKDVEPIVDSVINKIIFAYVNTIQY